MRTRLADWQNGWFGVELALSPEEIEALIGRLRMLQQEPDQHFHLTSTYQESGGLGDLMVYVQDPSEQSNMEPIGSKALAPGEILP